MIRFALKDLIQVGNLYKSIGIKGEILLDLNPGFDSAKKSLSYLFIKKDGQSIPYFIEHIRTQGKNEYVKFEGINSPEDAGEIANVSLYLDKDKIEELNVELDLEVANLIGFELYNKGVVIGKITGLHEYPGQVVMEIDQLNNTVIPLVDDWIIEVNSDKKWIKMTFDEELLNLND